MFTWNSDYSVGIDEIDRQHQKFIKIINEIVDLFGVDKKNPIIAIKILELEDYAKWHFQTELSYLKKCTKCSSNEMIEEHIKEHDEILKKIAEFRKDIGNFDAESVPQLVVFVKKWFINHTVDTDKRLYNCILQNNYENIIIKDKNK